MCGGTVVLEILISAKINVGYKYSMISCEDLHSSANP